MYVVLVHQVKRELVLPRRSLLPLLRPSLNLVVFVLVLLVSADDKKLIIDAIADLCKVRLKHASHFVLTSRGSFFRKASRLARWNLVGWTGDS